MKSKESLKSSHSSSQLAEAGALRRDAVAIRANIFVKLYGAGNFDVSRTLPKKSSKGSWYALRVQKKANLTMSDWNLAS